MTLTAPETGLDILSELDFDPEPPCEHGNHGRKPWHQGPGEILVAHVDNPCTGCGRTPWSGYTLLCRSSFEYAGQKGLACPSCFANHPREHWWRLAGGIS